jgi:circadian clock protein KaiB
LVFFSLLRQALARSSLSQLIAFPALAEQHRTPLEKCNVTCRQGAIFVTEPILRLYIGGNAASSRRAQRNLERLRTLVRVEAWKIEIIDVLANPELAEQASVLATPTLCYHHSGRPRRIIGDLSDTKRVLEFLGIDPKEGAV